MVPLLSCIAAKKMRINKKETEESAKKVDDVKLNAQINVRWQSALKNFGRCRNIQNICIRRYTRSDTVHI